MAGFLRSRLPHRNEFLGALAVAAAFVGSWAVRGFLHELPSFLGYFRFGEIAAIFAYTMAVALLESAALTAGLVLVAFALPRDWFRAAFNASSFLTVLVGAAAMIRLGSELLVDTRQLPPASFYMTWGAAALATWGLVLLLARKYSRLRRTAAWLAEAAGMLGGLYLALGALGLLVVLFRNL